MGNHGKTMGKLWKTMGKPSIFGKTMEKKPMAKAVGRFLLKKNHADDLDGAVPLALVGICVSLYIDDNLLKGRMAYICSCQHLILK